MSATSLGSPSRREAPDLCVVSGAGPVGCLAALMLSKKESLSIMVLEKRPDHRNAAGQTTELRSINLALSERGRQALRAVGIEEEVLRGAVPMTGRAVHLENGTTAFQHYDDLEQSKCIYSVSRRVLNDALLNELEKKKNVKIIFNQRVASIERPKIGGKGAWVVTNTNDRIRARLVLGCDGSYSSVREAMSRIICMDFSRKYIDMGYMELHIPAGENGKYKLAPYDALHIWPREAESHMMMIALPNMDGSFTATLFAPFKTLISLAESESLFQGFMRQHFSECLTHLDGTHGGAHALFTSTVSPWNVEDFALLLGDAAHSQVPFFGQGMNAGLEDAHQFFKALEETSFNWSEAIRRFEPKRRPCGDAITKLSLENYEEMHTHAASFIFRVRRRFEGMIAKFSKGKLAMPLYYAVAFTTEPYDVVLARKRKIARIEEWTKWTIIALLGVTVGGTIIAQSRGQIRLDRYV